jgi:hypothetical protein
MHFLSALSKSDQETWLALQTPPQIQAFLDSIPYNGEDINRTPLRVMQDRQCHCLTGGILAALALSQIGYAPLLVDLIPIPDLDDDHVLAVFRQQGLWGAVAKSNFAGLRYRDPVYRSLRELVMSYFEVFYNVNGIKTLRGYTRPLNLVRYDPLDWQTSQAGVDAVIDRLYNLKFIPVVPEASIPLIAPLDRRSYEVGFIGVNIDGLYKAH